MNSQAKICQICGKVINLSNSAGPDFCQCQQITSNPPTVDASQLDAIPTPGASGNQVQPAKFTQSDNLKSQLDSIPAPTSDEQTIPPASADSGGLKREVQTNMSAGQTNQTQGGLKNQLDSIPTPGAVAPAGSPPPAPTGQGLGANLKASLDSIPTPKAANPSPQVTQTPPAQQQQIPAQTQSNELKSALDSIPQGDGMPQAAQSQMPQPAQAQMPQAAQGQMPQAQQPSQPQLVETPNQAQPNPQPDPDDWKSQLDAIPTPKGLDGGGQPGPGAAPGAGTPTPTPAPSLAQNSPQSPQPSAPQPMPGASPELTPYQPNSTDGFSRSKEFSSVDASQGYTMIFVVIIFIICCVFAYMMMNPTKTADFSKVDSQAQSQTP